MKKISMVSKTWSFSRYVAFKNCPKSLWLGENSKFQTRNLIPLYSLIGTSVHKAISFWIDKWSRGVEVTNKEAKKVGIVYIREVWKDRDQVITEFFNGTQTDDPLGSKIESSYNTLIDNFFLYIWPTFVNEKYVTHEKLFELPHKDYRILLKPDLITKNSSGSFTITDWKSSMTHNDSLESFQVLTYGFWATRFYKMKPDQIKLQVVNLRTGRIMKDNFSEAKLKETVDKIEVQMEELNKIYQNKLLEAKPEINKCQRCNHLQSCDEGQRKLAGI